MDPIALAGGLSRFPRRTAGTDAERRASRWLAAVLAASEREAEVETSWVRPHWPLVHALHAGLGVAASVVAVSVPAAGLALALVALASVVLDGAGVAHLVRSLTPARATQNLVSQPTAATRSGRERIVRLVICAPYDAPRGGVVFAERVRRAVAAAQRVARGRIPGPLAWLALALALVAGAAGGRLAGAEGPWLDALQVVPTLGLMAGIAALVDVLLSQPAPGAGEPASGAGVAIALATALDRDPPRRLAVELVLTGGGDLGMRQYVRARRRRWRAEATAVLQLAACGRGTPRWWVSDGPLFALRLHPRLVALAAETGRGARRRGHGAGAAWRARVAGWPAIAIGCRTDDAWPPDARRPADVAERLDPAAMDAALQLALALVRALDADLDAADPAD
jgi:hypothetical protein